MTPQELHAALAAVRTERGLFWWQIAVKADVSEIDLRQLRRGGRTGYYKALAWLEKQQPTERDTGPPRTE